MNIYSLYSLVIIGIFTVSLTSCNFLGHGNWWASNSIKESEKNNLFVCEYKVQNYIVLNDSLKLDINSIWLEHIGEIDSKEHYFTKKIIPLPYYQLIIVTNNEDLLKTYNQCWEFKRLKNGKRLNNFSVFGKHNNCLVSQFRSDTMLHNIEKWDIYLTSNTTKIGEIVLEKM